MEQQLLLANGNSKSQFNALKDWKNNSYLNLLNVAYDITKQIYKHDYNGSRYDASFICPQLYEYEAATND